MDTAQDELDPRRRTAYHEAGHAVVAWALRMWPRRASILSDLDRHGRMHVWRSRPVDRADTDVSPAAQRHFEKRATVSFAGFIAEKKHTGEACQWRGADHTDIREALTALGGMCGSREEINAYANLSSWPLVHAKAEPHTMHRSSLSTFFRQRWIARARIARSLSGLR